MEKNEAQLMYKSDAGGVITFSGLDGDMTLYEFHDLCARLAAAIGYHPKNIKEYFGEEI